MRLAPNEVHVWFADLALAPEQIDYYATLLNAAELEKALRFRFDRHRERYIVARGLLRKILGLYLDTAPADIQLAYDDHDKPYVPERPIQFNLSHSETMAVYAIAHQHPVGIDIEKIRDSYQADVAARYFSPEENAFLANTPPEEQVACFYQIWARKEALIKACGKGLSIPLHDFSTVIHAIPEIVPLEGVQWRLYPLQVHPQYASALAADMRAEIRYWRLLESGPQPVL